mmetsp:Transcript_17373/g.27234  ORF Transcript_17373/g.27234 Transcript_17373/m.27234 type:complete len:551 (-) Transcript_17373:1029-2681(-)
MNSHHRLRKNPAALLLSAAFCWSLPAAALEGNEPEQPQSLTDKICFGRPRAQCEVELDVPAACAADGSGTDPSCPIVFFLHGSGGTNTWYPKTSGVHDANMIGVYPQGEGGWNTGPKDTNLCAWDDFECDTDPDEGDFIASIIDEIRALGGTGNVYAYGNSNGAALAHRLASNGGTRLPIKGIIVSVTQLLASPERSGPGSLNYNQPSSTRGTPPVSILSILGDADPVIPYKGGSAGVFGGDQAFQLMSALDSMSYWASHNGCTGKYLSSQHSTNMGDGAATKYDYTPGCPNGIYVEHYAIHGGQHNAGGAEVDGAKIDVLGFVAKVEGETPSPPSSSLPTPTPPTSGCDNDPSWSGKFSLVHTCDYVALNPETRCSFKNHEGVTANDACPGACNTSCSTPPASLSPVASPPVDTSSPVASPSPTCVRCDDLPTPWMVFNGKTCDGSEWLISDKCVVDQNWVTNGYCRSSCYTAGRGYVNEVCCPPPTPPSSCTDCSDDATPSMENNAKTCATSSIESNCYKNDWWRSNNYCQQSCYFAGYGYEGIVCCA